VFCVCVWERERENVCVFDEEKETKKRFECVFYECIYVCVCVCVNETVRLRERESVCQMLKKKLTQRKGMC